ncbi:hypothetical protein KKG65_01120 [Patescibacteria group bacterium]|nr:hypothetical protein [Patescibacteria group bacterium]
MSEEKTEVGSRQNLTEYGLPVVNTETINTLQADIRFGQHTTAEWAGILEGEQPELFGAIKSLASGHGDNAPKVFRDIVVTYIALRKQAKSNKLSSVFQVSADKK